MGMGLEEEGKVPAGRNGVLCIAHLNDPQLFGFYEVELMGADLTGQLTHEIQELIDSGFIEEGRKAFRRTMGKAAADTPPEAQTRPVRRIGLAD
jgi:hypothetical protein